MEKVIKKEIKKIEENFNQLINQCDSLLATDLNNSVADRKSVLEELKKRLEKAKAALMDN